MRHGMVVIALSFAVLMGTSRCVAQEATRLTGSQIAEEALAPGAYVLLDYQSRHTRKRMIAEGTIRSIENDLLRVARGLWHEEILLADINSLTVGRSRAEVIDHHRRRVAQQSSVPLNQAIRVGVGSGARHEGYLHAVENGSLTLRNEYGFPVVVPLDSVSQLRVRSARSMAGRALLAGLAGAVVGGLDGMLVGSFARSGTETRREQGMTVVYTPLLEHPVRDLAKWGAVIGASTGVVTSLIFNQCEDLQNDGERAFLVGALAGSAVGTAVGYGAYGRASEHKGRKVVLLGLLGLASGGPISQCILPKFRWRALPVDRLRLGLAPHPTGAVALGGSVSF